MSKWDEGPGISAERVSAVVGTIYDCVLDPSRWVSTLEAINRDFAFASSVLGILPLQAGSQSVTVNAGIDPEWLAVGDRYAADAIELWGGFERIQQFPLDEPIIGSRQPAYARRHEIGYFKDVLEPRGLFDCSIIVVARTPSLLGYLGFNRHVTAGEISESEISGMRLLAPHLRRAVTISNIIEMKRIEVETFTSTLDTFSRGIVLVDQEVRVVHANSAAKEILSQKRAIRLDRGVLTLRPPHANIALQTAIRLAARNEVAMGQKGIGIPVRDQIGDAEVVHVLPLKRRDIPSRLAQSAVAAIFIAAGAGPQLPRDELALLYDLTPAEIRVCELVCQGMTLEIIGQTLGIAKSTAKTHLLNIYRKTDCKRRVELVKLASSLSLSI